MSPGGGVGLQGLGGIQQKKREKNNKLNLVYNCLHNQANPLASCFLLLCLNTIAYGVALPPLAFWNISTHPSRCDLGITSFVKSHFCSQEQLTTFVSCKHVFRNTIFFF